MKRRPGFTLIEILITLFILMSGLLAILTLFPLAASQMAIAVREDRSAQAATQADAFFRSYWKSLTEQPTFTPATSEPFYQALNSPGDPALPAPLIDEWSYPVLVDPMGFVARSGQVNQTWVGDLNAGSRTTNVPRRSLNLITNPATNGGNQSLYSMKLCSLPDSLSYNDDGVPQNPVSTLAEREWRYNWAWVVQRTNRNPNAATLTIVVFDKRAPLFTPAGSEVAFGANFTPGSTTVVVTGTPDLKPGGWVMDATVGIVTNFSPPGPRPTPLRHANFYQVVSVTPGGAGTTNLELQTVVKAPSDTGFNPSASAGYTGTLVVLRGVSGVYPKPPLGN
jgi:type II secretory pathway pseudopilin PulG